MNRLESLQATLAEARTRLDTAVDAIDDADNEITEDDLAALNTEFDEAEEGVRTAQSNVERAQRLATARAAAPGGVVPAVQIGNEVRTYRPGMPYSFFVDMITQNTNPQARDRIAKHQEENRAEQERVNEARGVTAGGGGSGFVPPVYLAAYEADLPRPGRPFADVLPKGPVPTAGTSILVPAVSTGTTVAAIGTEGSSVSDTDATTTQITTNIAFIVGQADLSRVAYERTFPGLDVILFRDLMHAYDAELDKELLVGTGTGFQHLGLANVSGINTATYTDGSPSGGQLIKQVYNAIQLIASTRYVQPDMIVMHPRRAAWLAATQSSTFPLFQQGMLGRGFGTQNDGFAGMLAGLPVVIDPNIPTNVATNQDEIFVIVSSDLVLMEDDLVSVSYEETLSGTAQVRLQVRAYSYFLDARFPKGICSITGTGLTTPTFT